jgi:GNAT superfamily N-acetyltransferase
MLIRDYRRSDAAEITRLFYETVRSVNLQHYSQEQVHAWAPAVPDPAAWHSRMSRRSTLVAEEDGQIVGFTELQRDGHLDMFYCRKDVVGRGVGRLLYQAVESKAIGLGLGRIFADVSITARRFFANCGFSVVRQQTVTRGGIELLNFRMKKRLPGITHPAGSSSPGGPVDRIRCS